MSKPRSQADSILDMIRLRNDPNYKPPVEEIKREDWYKFTSGFVEEVDGKKVNEETGMTNKEYLDFLRDSNSLAGSTVDQKHKDLMKKVETSPDRLREFLRGLDTKNNFEDIFDKD